ncbi:hypothetical protein AVEN_69562-1 [Araneus ventricosus]|uniref:Uncharacterized protein n=1 Tax=Araneus ventricosus TaxID=182803 RepID=A0A4Y2NPM7_ARAVE|nr:hypothetical protein AVEN_36608-1 [Araneus ventricosus]GBN41550.1 hypothetical protein AVEN_69562-1 [Araneus ventricosus]
MTRTTTQLQTYAAHQREDVSPTPELICIRPTNMADFLQQINAYSCAVASQVTETEANLRHNQTVTVLSYSGPHIFKQDQDAHLRKHNGAGKL